MMLTEMPMVYAGGGFPWGLLIIGGIVYFLWTKGVFDGRGRFGNGGRWGGGPGGGYGPGPGAGYGQTQMTDAPGYGPSSGSGQGSTPGYDDPRAMFEAWHRQAHESHGAQHQTHAAPPAPSAPPAAPATETRDPGSDEPTRQV